LEWYREEDRPDKRGYKAINRPQMEETARTKEREMCSKPQRPKKLKSIPAWVCAIKCIVIEGGGEGRPIKHQREQVEREKRQRGYLGSRVRDKGMVSIGGSVGNRTESKKNLLLKKTSSEGP